MFFLFQQIKAHLCVVCATLLLCSAVYTQDYVVTASREKEDSLSSPANTIVITAADIKESGKSTLVQLLKDTPGLNFTSVSSDAQAQVQMRGFGESSFGRVLVMVDGKRLNNPDMSGINWLSVPLASIERIEVVDGPSSALYGNNAVGGVINIITKEPTKKLSGTASSSLGCFWTFNSQFSISTASEKTGFTASIDQFNTDGWRDRTGSKITNALVSGFVDISDKLLFKSSLNYTDSFYEMPGSLTETQLKKNPRQAKYYDDDSAMKNVGASVSFHWDAFQGFSAVFPVDYSFKHTKTNNPSFFTPSFSDGVQHRANFMPSIQYEKTLTDFFTLKVAGGADSGAVWLNQKSFGEKQRTSLTNKTGITQYQLAPYAHIQAVFGKHGSVGATVRYDTAWIDAKNKDGSIRETTQYGALVYSLDAVYRPLKQISLYVRGGSLFRYPFVDEAVDFYGFSSTFFNKGLKPETGYNAELGIRTDFGKYFSGTLNAYYMPMKNEIWYNPTTFQNENYMETLHIGGSISAKTKPVQFFSAQASCSYVYAIFSAGSYKDKKIPLVPEISTSASVSFYVPYFSITPDISFKSDSFQGGDYANTQKKISSYFLLGFTATFTPKISHGNLSFALRADNLLNVLYTPLVYYSESSGTSGYYPASGRSFAVSARYTF